MDKYLEAIEKEEEKVKLLEQKRIEIENSNQRNKQKINRHDKEEAIINQKLEKYRRIKYYLQNKKSCTREFIKRAIFFGIKCGIGFMSITLVLSFLSTGLHLLPLLKLLSSFLTISSLLGLVEYKNVSREYRNLVSTYHGNIDVDLENLEKNKSELQKDREKNLRALESNQTLLEEIDKAIKELQESISSYRSSRNNLIESLIDNLDSYIIDFVPHEIDIHKVIEKKIH